MTSVPMGRPLSRNLVVNVVGPLLPMVVSFVTVPLYIHAIGAARYGVVTLTWILLGYLGVLDFGLSRAAANALGRLAHASSRERSSVLITTLYLNLLFGLTASAVFYAIGGALLWRWFPLSGELAHEAVAAFPWMVPMLPLGLLSGVAIGALDSRERFLLGTTLNSCGVVLGLVLPLVSVMIFGPSLTVIIPAVMRVRLGVVLAMLTAVFWVERPIHSFAPDFVWARKLFGYGAWVSVSSVISPILDTFDQMIIGRMLGAAAVAHYAVPMNLAIRSQVLAQALARTLFPRLSRETIETGRHLTGRAALSLIYVFGAICGPAIVVIGPFLNLWVGREFAEASTLVAQILLFGAWMNGVALLPYSQLQAQGRPNVTAHLHMVEIVPFLLCLWLLIEHAGLPGAALAWTLRVGADCLALLWFARSLHGMALRALPAVGLMLLSFAIAAGQQPAPISALALGSVLGIAFLAFGIMMEPKLGDTGKAIAERMLRLSLKRMAS
jgi:O-antigen/teichoic acid export membrane protein